MVSNCYASMNSSSTCASSGSQPISRRTWMYFTVHQVCNDHRCNLQSKALASSQLLSRALQVQLWGSVLMPAPSMALRAIMLNLFTGVPSSRLIDLTMLIFLW